MTDEKREEQLREVYGCDCNAVNGESRLRKPPLGPMPDWLWREQRMWHLIERLAAIDDSSDQDIYSKWLTELKERIEDFERYNAEQTEDG